MSGISGINPNSIDWKALTADEIKSFKDEGVDVPIEYEEWAETATDNNVKYSDAVSASDATGQETQYNIVEDDAAQTNEAAEEYQELADSGVGLIQMANIFATKCEKQEAIVQDAMSQTQQLAASQATAEDEITANANASSGEIDSLISELNAVRDEGKTKTTQTTTTTDEYGNQSSVTEDTTAQASEDLENQISGVAAKSALDQVFANKDLSDIAGKIKTTSETATNAEEYANQTMDVADQCYAKAKKSTRTNRSNYSKKIAAANAAAQTSGTATNLKGDATTNKGKNALRGLAVGTALGAGAGAAIGFTALSLTSTAAGGIVVASGLNPVALGVLAGGMLLGAVIGGLFGSSKKKKYNAAGEKADKAGTSLDQNAAALADNAEQVANKNGLILTRSKDETAKVKAKVDSIRQADTTQKTDTATDTIATTDNTKKKPEEA